MKLVSYEIKDKERLGIFFEGKIFDVQKNGTTLGLNLPSSMKDFLNGWDKYYNKMLKLYQKITKGYIKKSYKKNEIKLLAPVPHPTSCRDGYAFRQHVETARRNRGVEMIPEFDQFPVFYFTNHNAVFGEGDIVVEDDHLERLDFELEAAVVINKRGKNIKSHEADSFIAGYMVMNDLSARRLQSEEMKLNLGPAKGKDFATTIGPYLVTTDELETFKITSPVGNKYDLEMKAYHNGKQVSEGNLKDMNWTFAQIIERASYGVEIFPGDIIGSGTVGTGCYLELNDTWALEAKAAGKEFTPIWLKENDIIELEIAGLGRLSNKIIKSPYNNKLKK